VTAGDGLDAAEGEDGSHEHVACSLDPLRPPHAPRVEDDGVRHAGDGIFRRPANLNLNVIQPEVWPGPGN